MLTAESKTPTGEQVLHLSPTPINQQRLVTVGVCFHVHVCVCLCLQTQINDIYLCINACRSVCLFFLNGIHAYSVYLCTCLGIAPSSSVVEDSALDVVQGQEDIRYLSVP